MMYGEMYDALFLSARRILYALLFAQFSFEAFYDPARRALMPQIVPRGQLHLATTMDAWSWALMSAIGSAMGGWVTSRLGSSAAYLLDALSYVIAALFALCILVSVMSSHRCFPSASW